MTYATTFSGIGGWEIGLNACDWGLRWQCEKDAKCLAFLAERFGVPVHGDIRSLSESGFQKVDVLIGSPPCQPFSTAGKRRGTSDERHLYSAFLDAVRTFRPRYVLMEQVPAILSPERKHGRVIAPAPIGQYVGRLASLGYLGCYHCIPACAVGAPHRRDRIWIIAHAGHDAGCPESIQQCEVSAQKSDGLCAGGLDANVTDAQSEQIEREGSCGFQSIASQRNTSDGRSGLSQEDAESVGNALSIRREGSADESRIRDTKLSRQLARIRRNRGWKGYWKTEPDVGRVAYGIPHRLDRLKGLGNAVVPQIPYIIGKAINKINSIYD